MRSHVDIFSRQAGITCGICLSVHYDTNAATQPCGHVFCVHCLFDRAEALESAREEQRNDWSAPPPGDAECCAICKSKYPRDRAAEALLAENEDSSSSDDGSGSESTDEKKILLRHPLRCGDVPLDWVGLASLCVP